MKVQSCGGAGERAVGSGRVGGIRHGFAAEVAFEAALKLCLVCFFVFKNVFFLF